MRVIGFATAVFIALSVHPAWSDDPAPANLTKNQFDQITSTETPSGQTPETIVPIRDLTPANAQELKHAGAKLRVEGGVWKDKTPAEREQQLKDMFPRPGTIFLIEVPSGNVWVIAPKEDKPMADRVNELQRDHTISIWFPYQVLALPVSVANAPTSGDRAAKAGEAVAVLNFGFKY